MSDERKPYKVVQNNGDSHLTVNTIQPDIRLYLVAS